MNPTLKSTLRIISIASVFLVLLTPLIVSNGMFFPFITGKAYFFRIVSLIGFSSWLVLMAGDRDFRPKKSWLSWSILAFVFIVLLADIFGINPIKAFWSNYERSEGWFMILHLVMFYFVATTTLTKNMWRAWLGSSVGVSVIIMLYAFLQMAGLLAIHQGSTRLDATLGNSAYLAVYILIHIFIAVYLAWEYLTQSYKKAQYAGTEVLGYALLVVAGLHVIILYNTGTRGSMLGLIGAVIVSALLYLVLERGWTIGRKISLGIIIAVIVLITGFISIRDTEFVRNSPVLHRFASISISDTKTQARGYVWPMSIQGAIERPFLGWGQEGFSYVFNTHYDSEMYRHEQWFDRAHNVFLDWLIASGFIGVILYILLYVFSIFYVYKAKQLSLAERVTLIGLIIAYAIHNIFVFDNISSYVMFFGLLAYINHIRNTNRNTVEVKSIDIREDNKNHIHKGLNPEVVTYGVLPGVAIFLIIFGYVVNVRPVQANYALIDALRVKGGPSQLVANFERSIDLSPVARQESREQMILMAERIVASQADQTIKQDFLTSTLKQIDAQISEAPKDARIYLITGSMFNRIRQPSLAMEYLAKARELTPRKQAPLMELAIAYLSIGKNPEAVSLAQQAWSMAPEYDEAATIYAVTLILDKQYSKVDELVENNPRILIDQRISTAYFSVGRYDKALPIYKELIIREPSNERNFFVLAGIYLALGQNQEAISIIQQASKISPSVASTSDALIAEIRAGRNPINLQ